MTKIEFVLFFFGIFVVHLAVHFYISFSGCGRGNLTPEVVDLNPTDPVSQSVFNPGEDPEDAEDPSRFPRFPIFFCFGPCGFDDAWLKHNTVAIPDSNFFTFHICSKLHCLSSQLFGNRCVKDHGFDVGALLKLWLNQS